MSNNDDGLQNDTSENSLEQNEPIVNIRNIGDPSLIYQSFHYINPPSSEEYQ